jgi:hypothetical protein
MFHSAALLIVTALASQAITTVTYGTDIDGENIAWLAGDNPCNTGFTVINRGGSPCGAPFTLRNGFTYQASETQAKPPNGSIDAQVMKD